MPVAAQANTDDRLKAFKNKGKDVEVNFSKMASFERF